MINKYLQQEMPVVGGVIAELQEFGVAEAKYEFRCRDVPWNVSTRVWRSSKIIFIPQISNAEFIDQNPNVREVRKGLAIKLVYQGY
jgi:hypothetical protein